MVLLIGLINFDQIDIAKRGDDYEAGPYYVNISEGDTVASLCINITDNNELQDDDKFFTLTINTTELHPEIIPKNHSANVTILDDKCKNINNER